MPALQRFPPCPLRDIHARYVRQTSEPARYAAVTVDFEPRSTSGLEAGDGVVLEIPHGLRIEGFGEHEGLGLSYLRALVCGIHDELARHQNRVATRVLLRYVRFHPVDSSEESFRAVGQIAARIAVERALPRPG